MCPDLPQSPKLHPYLHALPVRPLFTGSSPFTDRMKLQSPKTNSRRRLLSTSRKVAFRFPWCSWKQFAYIVDELGMRGEEWGEEEKERREEVRKKEKGGRKGNKGKGEEERRREREGGAGRKRERPGKGDK